MDIYLHHTVVSLFSFIAGIFYGVCFTSIFNYSWQKMIVEYDARKKNKKSMLLGSLPLYFLRYLLLLLLFFILVVKMKAHVVHSLIFFGLGFWIYTLKQSKGA